MLAGIWLIAMLIGFVYLRFVVGAKGYEQIPFYTYYQEFGNLEAVSYNMNTVPAVIHGT